MNKIIYKLVLLFALTIFISNKGNAIVEEIVIKGHIASFDTQQVTIIDDSGVEKIIPRSFLAKGSPVVGSYFRMVLNDADVVELKKIKPKKKADK